MSFIRCRFITNYAHEVFIHYRLARRAKTLKSTYQDETYTIRAPSRGLFNEVSWTLLDVSPSRTILMNVIRDMKGHDKGEDIKGFCEWISTIHISFEKYSQGLYCGKVWAFSDVFSLRITLTKSLCTTDSPGELKHSSRRKNITPLR